MFDTALTFNDFLFLGRGAGWTLLITAIAVVVGTVLGVIFGVFRAVVPWWASMLARVPARYLPLGAAADPAGAGQFLHSHVRHAHVALHVSCIVLSLYTSAYCSEIVRGRRAGRAGDHPPRRALARA